MALDIKSEHRDTQWWVKTKSDEAAVAQGCYFDLDAALRFSNFSSNFARHSTGEWAGRKFELLPWQFFDVYAPIYGWKRPDGTRRIDKFALGVAKKNGKSTLSGLQVAYHLIGDKEPANEIYLCASDVDQARIVYREADKFITASPYLKSAIKVVGYRNKLQSKRDSSFAQVLSREAATKHGYNSGFTLFDEFHTQKNWDLWNVMKYAGAARKQPLLGWISTAGNDVELPWHSQWEYARGILNGSIIKTDTHAAIYEVPESVDPADESQWHLANPSLGLTISLDRMRGEWEEAKSMGPIAIRDFRQLRLNQIVKSGLDWIHRDRWDRLKGDVSGDSITWYAGLDLASTRDFNALVLLGRDDTGRYLHKCWFWRPVNGGMRKEVDTRQLFQSWNDDGHIKLTPGEFADWNVIYTDIMEICRTHRIRELAYDPTNFGPMVPKLEAAGIKLVTFRQNRQNYNAPTREFERIVFTETIRHQGNPCMSWMIGNTLITADATGNVMPDRSEKRSAKIDGVPASIMAASVAIRYIAHERRDFTSY